MNLHYQEKTHRSLKKFVCLPLGIVGISSISMAELEYGVKKSTHPEKNQIALNQFLIPLEIFNFDSNAAFEYGIIRADLESKGTPIGSLDTLIAAHARSLELTLVTNNEREFERGNRSRIANWVKE